MKGLTQFAQTWHTTPDDLLLLNLQFARNLAYPELDLAAYQAKVVSLVEEAARVLPATQANTRAQAERLTDFLFFDIGLRGNKTQYHDERNSFMNEVLDRQVGLPISLSMLYVNIARRLGLNAFGVALPGHFIAGIQTDSDLIYLDPFYQTFDLDVEDCVQLICSTGLAQVQAAAFDPRWLLPANSVTILTRMLTNLKYLYIRTEKWTKALLAVQHLQIVDSDNADHWRDIGILYYHAGRLHASSEALTRYLQLYPTAPDAETMRGNLQAVLDQLVRLN
jgi:regulator of sirC expression with transglutaminase-like and TPR domain